MATAVKKKVGEKRVVHVLCFGNSLLEEDAMAKKIAEQMEVPHFLFVPCNTPEEIMFYADKEIVLLDVAKNITRTMVIPDIVMLKAPHMVSIHDFDLAYFLKMMEKMGKKAPMIIAVPPYGNMAEIRAEVTAELQRLYPRS